LPRGVVRKIYSSNAERWFVDAWHGSQRTAQESTQ